MRRFYLILSALALLGVLLFVFWFIPSKAASIYGPASPRLSLGQRVRYSVRLLWHDGLLTLPADLNGVEQDFAIAPGELPMDIARRLEESGLIRSAGAFVDYLVYSGYDTGILPGRYRLSPSQTAMNIAATIQDSRLTEVDFVVLPGWRMEEIAASLPTSGLNATPDQFLQAARNPLRFDFLDGAATNEGFFLPDTYLLPRSTTAQTLVETLVNNFAQRLTPELEAGFAARNLTVYQAVTLASLVERESVVADEMPLIASVFLNRLSAGWKLDSDPTVQYVVGIEGNWWPNPLSEFDLQVDSAYNTYLYTGLPPAPIANPSLEALEAVANPASTPYFFFRARCDGSGLHNFAVTLEEHIQNECP